MYYACFIIAYLLGGIPFGLIVGYVSGHGDVRDKGSGNIGSTNVWRIAGPGAAAVVFACDIGKGAAVIIMCRYLYEPGVIFSLETSCLLAGLLAVVGHSFSPYIRFKGGKGVNTALGVFIYILPIQSLVALSVFVLVFLVTRYVSLSSILATSTLAGVLFVEKFLMHRPIANAYLITTSLVALLILITHRGNIRRLMAGNESRFQLRKAVD